MLYKVYTVYDTKAEIYMNPFFQKARGEAIRSFTNLANDESTTVGKYPADFVLFEIGEYDDSSGELISGVHTSLGVALEYVGNSVPMAVS